MRLFPFLSLLVLLIAASGCATRSDGNTTLEGDCAKATHATSLVEVRGTDLVVDQGDLVLHANNAKLFVLDGAGCHAAVLSDLHPGDALRHDADQIAESYPAQAWPTTVVLVR